MRGVLFLRAHGISLHGLQCYHVLTVHLLQACEHALRPVVLQVIDDSMGSTLVAASTLTPEIREKLNGSGGGNQVGTPALPFSCLHVVFGGCSPHGNEAVVDTCHALCMCRGQLSWWGRKSASCVWPRTSAQSLLTEAAMFTTAG